jgi:hypothetical protein
MAKQVETEIEIDASAEVVWKILTDFDGIAEWNDFIRHIEGERSEGSKLTVELWLGDRKPMTFKPRLLAYKENREFRWKGRVLIPGIFDGEHSFEIEELSPGKVRFLHCEKFSGIAVPLLFGGMKTDIYASFRKMNESLKQRAEALMTEQGAAQSSSL